MLQTVTQKQGERASPFFEIFSGCLRDAFSSVFGRPEQQIDRIAKIQKGEFFPEECLATVRISLHRVRPQV